jgi:protein SPT2
MEFQELLTLASDNQKKSKKSSTTTEVKFLSAKIAPPQKDVKQTKMSENVKKLLESLDSRTPTTSKSNVKILPPSAIDCNDEDDYGYESKSASAYFDKLMTKYEKVPKADSMESKSNMNKTKVASSSKLPVTMPRRDNAGEDKEQKCNTTKDHVKSGKSEDVKKKASPSSEVAKKKTPAGPKHPPPPSFADLIRMAEEAKLKPVEVKPKSKCDRPMTSKEKDKANQARKSASIAMAAKNKVGKPVTATSNGKPVGGKSSPDNCKLKSVEKKLEVHSKKIKSSQGNSKPKSVETKLEDHSKKMKDPKKVEKSPPQTIKAPPKIVGPEFHPAVVKARPTEKSKSCNMDKDRKGQMKRVSEVRNPDKKRSGVKRPRSRSPSPEFRRKSDSKKRLRINSESEYDSEMDDFIDDTEATIDISAEIRNIFGYDRNKYRNETDFDDRSMENNRFADIMKEEARSARLGRMEDLEDMRREEEEKRRKSKAMKKR